jgi:butyrate kinase
MYRILVINPGSTSTKIALFENEHCLWSETIQYNREQLEPFENVLDQLEMRRRDLEQRLIDNDIDLNTLSAIVGRGGPFKPLTSGTYEITQDLLDDIQNGRVQAEHISNIGVLLARELGLKAGKSAYFVDPVSVDEFEPIARISGLPELERRSLLHALNVKAIAYRYAEEHKKFLIDINLIVAHLGGGISICPLKKGRIIDVNNANEGGPFSPERVGSLPVSSLIKLCYSGEFTYEEMKKRLIGNGGLVAYLETNDTREVEERIQAGDQKAKLIYQAMSYQIAKEIGAMATVLQGSVEAILLTGGIAHSTMLTQWIQDRVSYIAPVYLYPGEDEMESMAMGVLRVLRGEQHLKQY